MPRVSVVLPTYNHEKLVRECIQSVLGQTYQDFEVVITDDGSTDGTVNVIKEFDDSRIQLYTHAENKGACTAINNCIRKAVGEYIAVLNSDDAWEPTKLEKQVKYLDSHPEIGAVFTKVTFVDETGNLIDPENYGDFYIFEQENRSRYEWLKFFFSSGNCLCHPSVLIRRKCYDEVGLYDERMANIPDQDMWTRLCFKYDIYILNEKLVHFRIMVEKSSASADKPSTHIRLSFEYLQILNHYLAITKRKSFLRIFPEAEKYGVVEEKYIPYFLSRLALDIGTRAWVLWGLQTLFNFLGQDDIAISLEKKYGFRYKDFYNLTAQRDIFNIEEVMAIRASLQEKAAQLSDLKSQIDSLESHIHSLEFQIQQIQQSVPMQLARRFERMANKLLPPWTRRRDLYLLGLMGARVMVNEGFRAFWSRAFRFIKSRGALYLLKTGWSKLGSKRVHHLHKPVVPHLKLTTSEDVGIAPSESDTISVVIPTKNGGGDFELLLSALNQQKGLKNLEVIVVDSGSSDGTVSIARAHGAEVLEILPEEFSHSHARNLGAEKATGNYLFFTVQDALPSSNVFLSKLLAALKNNDVVAVSCAEFPKEDVDLFYRTINWYHYSEFLDVSENDKVMHLPKVKNYETLRKNAQLSDIACLLPKEIFLKYKYSRQYAEDLDLGLRLIEDGYKLALLGSVKVIHSHNRSAYYWLKRGYVDALSLVDVFPSYQVPKVGEQQVLRGILLAYHSLASLINEDLKQIRHPIGLDMLFDLVGKKLDLHANLRSLPAGLPDTPYTDSNLKGFLERVLRSNRVDRERTPDDNVICQGVLRQMNLVRQYMEQPYPLADSVVLEDLNSCLLKTYAHKCGAYLAFLYLNGGNVAEWDNELREGI